jgi:sortase A
MIFMALGCCLVLGGVLGIAKASLMPIKAIVGQHYLEVAWQKSLRTNETEKPWRSADFYTIGELKVPRLRISRVILNTISGEAMAWGIGRINNVKPQSASGPVILAGHRDSHMKFMYELNVGDKIELIMSDGLMQTYIVSKTEITNKPELEIPESINKKNSLILSTCWPLNSSKQGFQRYIIFSQQAV